MLLKLGISLGLAAVVAIFTAVAGYVHEARLLTVLYRTLITLVGFSLGGYLVCLAVEGYFRRRFDEVKPKRQNVDIISKDGIIDNDELLNPSHASPQFSPLTPENFEQLKTKERP